MGLFDLNGQYFKPAYTFKAMGQMLDTPQRLAVEGTDNFGFAALAGRSEDGKTVQIFISNYAIAAGSKPRQLGKPPELADPTANRDNAGYNLAIANLPWGKTPFTLNRYRISASQNLDLVEEKSLAGRRLNLSNRMPTDTVELIVLQRK